MEEALALQDAGEVFGGNCLFVVLELLTQPNISVQGRMGVECLFLLGLASSVESRDVRVVGPCNPGTAVRTTSGGRVVLEVWGSAFEEARQNLLPKHLEPLEQRMNAA